MSQSVSKTNLITVRKTRNGKGLFVSRAFKRSGVLFRVEGIRAHWEKLLKRGGEFQNNAFRFGPETYITPRGRLGDFLNHSCNPNAKLMKKDGKLYIVAIKTIPKGTEIHIDYTTTLASDDIWEMNCNCGTRQCRKRIQNWTTLPESLRANYTISKIIPLYILKI